MLDDVSTRIHDLPTRPRPGFNRLNARHLEGGLLHGRGPVGPLEAQGEIGHKVLHHPIHKVLHRDPHIKDRDKDGARHRQGQERENQTPPAPERIADREHDRPRDPSQQGPKSLPHTADRWLIAWTGRC